MYWSIDQNDVIRGLQETNPVCLHGDLGLANSGLMAVHEQQEPTLYNNTYTQLYTHIFIHSYIHTCTHIYQQYRPLKIMK